LIRVSATRDAENSSANSTQTVDDTRSRYRLRPLCWNCSSQDAWYLDALTGDSTTCIELGVSPKSRKRKLKKSRARSSARAGMKPSKRNAYLDGQKFPVLLGKEFPGELGIKNPEIRAFLNEQYPAPIPQACAENIDVLLRRLWIEDNGHYLYRGQTRHFPALVPSIFRRAMIPGTEGDAIIGIDPNQFHGSLSERDKIRFRLLGEMMETYGPSVGNIIAQ
jgi:hypothetical protein